MRPDNARRNHVLFIVLGCIRRGVDMPCFAEIAAQVGFADGSSVNKALRRLARDGQLRIHRSGRGKVDGYETDMGWTRLNFGAGVHRPGRPRPVKDKEARDRASPDAGRRHAILDAVLAEGLNFRQYPIQGWLAEHARAYEVTP